ncbi:tRNA pseudouridine synthase B [Anaplasma phagocytophilum]|nr:tRNA pseudouridine synthase B [Anaplasma phagocytophilum]
MLLEFVQSILINAFGIGVFRDITSGVKYKSFISAIAMKHGWLNIDKPYGVSSGSVVGKLKKMLQCKVGHAGTLDPLATGVLPIAFGEATKTTNYATDTLKSYEVTIQWGEQRDTDDKEGKIIRTSALRPTEHSIKEALQQYVGVIQQIPSTFSAIKVGGMRAYSLSRMGKEVALAPRSVCITEIELLSVDSSSNTADLRITCGKGVYVRAVARDLGITLGCYGYVARLRRTMVGPFTEANIVTLQELETLVGENKLEEAVFPLSIVMSGLPHIEIDVETAKVVKNGRNIRLVDAALNGLYIVENCDMCYLSQAGGVPVAICEVVDGTAKPVRVFNV